jgi:hypothetical protein
MVSPRWCAMLVGAGLAVRLLVSAPGAAETPRPAGDEDVFDFGTVERGTPVEHVFHLLNRGSAPVRVDHVKSSCGCTVAVVSDRDIPAGGEGRIAVTLDTTRLAGRTTKTVSVYTNDPDLAVRPLSLTGQVTADLIVAPSPLYLGHVRRGDSASHEVTITPGRQGATYTVERVEHTNSAVRARVEPRPDGPGQRVVVELDPAMPLGRFSETLTLHTTSPREPTIALAVLGSVEGDLVVLPPQVTFGVTHGGAAERDLFLRNRGARPVAVTRVVVPDDVATCTVHALQEGLEYRLTVRLRDDLRPGRVEGAVEIYTDHPDEGHLVVPLYAIVRDGRRRG